MYQDGFISSFLLQPNIWGQKKLFLGRMEELGGSWKKQVTDGQRRNISRENGVEISRQDELEI